MEDFSAAQWYVLQVMSGQENKVMKFLTYRCEMDKQNGIDNGIHELNMPTERVEERSSAGKKIVRDRKLYPGYLLVKVRLFDDYGKLDPIVWGIINETQGVISFIGGDHPVSLAEDEVAEMLKQTQTKDDKPKAKVTYHIGETITIIDGAFENFEGIIETVDEERSKLQVSVSIFGRSTPVEVEFWQVERPI
ncbi:MAG: transcription termination/antitermination protein NusG [Lentisphaeria bacterium]